MFFGKNRARGYWPLRSSVSKFAGHQEGAAAVEFALVMVPFIALMFAIVETAIVFFANQTLDTATADSARLILTHQVQEWTPPEDATSTWRKDAFRQKICEKAQPLFNCDELFIDIKKSSSFPSDVSYTPQFDTDGNLTGGTFDIGDKDDIVIMRVLYKWPVYLSFFSFNLANAPGHTLLLASTAVFKNEP